MDIYNTLNSLKTCINASEGYHVSTFELVRTSTDGHEQTVRVEILDAGPEVNPELRYHCDAKSDDGREATGNPANNIETVLSTVHWEHLDIDR